MSPEIIPALNAFAIIILASESSKSFNEQVSGYIDKSTALANINTACSRVILDDGLNLLLPTP